MTYNPFNPVHREMFEERAAIMEYDGGMTRAEAEKQAKLDMETMHAIL